MIELGKKSEFTNVDAVLQPLTIIGRPTRMPELGEGEVLIGGLDQYIYERLFWCQAVEDMQQIYDSASRGGGSEKWYKAPMSFIEFAFVDISPDAPDIPE